MRKSPVAIALAAFMALSCASSGARSAGTFSSVDNTHKSQQELEADFDALTGSMETARAAFVPYRQDLNDIRTYLKNDLTATGLQSIS